MMYLAQRNVLKLDGLRGSHLSTRQDISHTVEPDAARQDRNHGTHRVVDAFDLQEAAIPYYL